MIYFDNFATVYVTTNDWGDFCNDYSSLFMMTSSNGNIFRVTGPLCGEFTDHRWIPLTGYFPSQRPVTRSFDVFFDLRLNKRLSKQSRRWWFETPPCSLWRHCNVPVYISTVCQSYSLFFISAMNILTTRILLCDSQELSYDISKHVQWNIGSIAFREVIGHNTFLTHWGLVTNYVSVTKAIIGSDNSF